MNNTQIFNSAAKRYDSFRTIFNSKSSNRNLKSFFKSQKLPLINPMNCSPLPLSENAKKVTPPLKSSLLLNHKFNFHCNNFKLQNKSNNNFWTMKDYLHNNTTPLMKVPEKKKFLLTQLASTTITVIIIPMPVPFTITPTLIIIIILS